MATQNAKLILYNTSKNKIYKTFSLSGLYLMAFKVHNPFLNWFF
jgi:hypothetical protein